MFKSKKYGLLLLICSLFFSFNMDVYADKEKDKVKEEEIQRTSVSLADKDYELVCEYNDGLILTVTRDGIYLDSTRVATSSTTASSSSVSEFYLTQGQSNSYDAEGKLTEVRIHNILDNKLFCPTKLQVQSIPDIMQKQYNYSEDEVKEMGFRAVTNFYSTGGVGQPGGEILKPIGPGLANTWSALFNKSAVQQIKEMLSADHIVGVFLLVYGIDVFEAAVNDFLEYLEPKTVVLVSEKVNLISPKLTKICDYQTKTSADNISTNSISIFLYENIQFLYKDGVATPLKNKITDCPSTDTLFINDPTPQAVGGDTTGKHRYNAVRFEYDKKQSGCKAKNDGVECQEYVFLGTRNGDGNIGDSAELCVFIGAKTTAILKEVIAWGQILIPALVLVLIGFDISKIVVSGNLEEELPKKKKSIIIRLIVAVVFFFAPTVVALIINLLQSADIDVGSISCLFS